MTVRPHTAGTARGAKASRSRRSPGSRREVIQARRGARARALDDAAQALTFATRIAARAALGRPHDRERQQLRAVLTQRDPG